MSDYIKGVQVGNEVKQYDYDALGNKPELLTVDDTLSASGKAADAKVVGGKFSKVEQSINNMNNQIGNLNDLVDECFGVALCQTASGEYIAVSDSADAPLQGLTVYGKSTQDGTPTPSAPVDIVSIENPTISVGKQNFIIDRVFHGIPVASGGNYTDSNGQQWICDEVDFARGVYVQRIYDVPMADMEWIVEKTTETYYEYKTYSSTAKLENGQLYTSHFAKTDDNRAVIGSNRNIYVRFPISTGIDTAEKANDFFANNNVVALGVLLEPIETLLSENEITAYRAIHSNYPNTTFLNDDGAHIAVKYVADTKTYIDNKLAELLNA